MRRSQTITIKEALEDLVREYRLGTGLKEASVIRMWEGITGKAITTRTKRIYIKEGVMHVHLSSAVVKNELMMLRATLIRRVNEQAGEEVIREIVLH